MAVAGTGTENMAFMSERNPQSESVTKSALSTIRTNFIKKNALIRSKLNSGPKSGCCPAIRPSPQQCSPSDLVTRHRSAARPVEVDRPLADADRCPQANRRSTPGQSGPRRPTDGAPHSPGCSPALISMPEDEAALSMYSLNLAACCLQPEGSC